jgi:deazaflavin-dependent oxidoreductase (nitroreductase family)
MCFPQADGTWYVAGSNFGLPKHPAWSANLIANPDADVHHGRRLTAVRATLFTPDFTPDEAEAIWPTFEEQWPRYRDYEKTAQRGIRVFRLMPAMGYV